MLFYCSGFTNWSLPTIVNIWAGAMGEKYASRILFRMSVSVSSLIHFGAAFLNGWLGHVVSAVYPGWVVVGGRGASPSVFGWGLWLIGSYLLGLGGLQSRVFHSIPYLGYFIFLESPGESTPYDLEYELYVFWVRYKYDLIGSDFSQKSCYVSGRLYMSIFCSKKIASGSRSGLRRHHISMWCRTGLHGAKESFISRVIAIAAQVC